MAETPKSVKVQVKIDAADVEILVAQGVAQGRSEGRAEGMSLALGWLEDRYINDNNRPDRDSAEGKAILKLARECAQFLRKELKKQ